MTEDSLGKALILTSTERMADALDLLERFDQLSWEQVTDMVTVGVWHQETQLHFLKLLKQAKANGAKSPAQIMNLEIELRQAIPHSFHISDKVAGVTGVGSLLFKRSETLPPWEMYNPNLLIRNFYEGQFGRISGLPRQGKTNLACVMLEQWTAHGGIAVSNILPAGPTDAYVYCPDARSLLKVMSKYQGRDDKKLLFILDEGGLIYAKADASTRRSKELDKLVRVLGKIHTSMVIVEQRPESVPTIIQEFATSVFYAHRPGIITFDLRGPQLGTQARPIVQKVRDFPVTTLPYDTYDIAYFDVNVDLSGTFKLLSGKAEERADILKAIGTAEEAQA